MPTVSQPSNTRQPVARGSVFDKAAVATRERAPARLADVFGLEATSERPARFGVMQIGQALGITDRSVRKRLGQLGIEPIFADGKKGLWSLDQLPEDWILTLVQKARAQGFRTASGYI